ncbi:unnamed protein product [Lampetra fluviatilis]
MPAQVPAVHITRRRESVTDFARLNDSRRTPPRRSACTSSPRHAVAAKEWLRRALSLQRSLPVRLSA